MLSEREILLRNVKCAAARERIYFISLDATASNFTMTAGHYFTSEGSAGRFTPMRYEPRRLTSILWAPSTSTAVATPYSLFMRAYSFFYKKMVAFHFGETLILLWLQRSDAFNIIIMRRNALCQRENDNFCLGPVRESRWCWHGSAFR